MQLSQLLNIAISRETQAVSQAGFGIPLIVGVNAGFSGVRSYTALADVLSDFSSSNDEYKAAAKIFGQSPHPTTVKIAKGLSKVAQVDTITPLAVDNHHYIVTIAGRKNGVAFSHDYEYDADGSATVSEIVTGLKAVINAGNSANGVTASGTTTVIITADVAGQPFSTGLNSDANLSLVHTTANVGLAEIMADLSLNHDDDFYGVISTVRSLDEIMNLADYIEGVVKLFGVSRNDSGMYDGSSTTDIAYLLKNGNYFRSFVMYSGDTANFPEAALMGAVLPLAPGSETWAFKSLAGIQTDNLTATQINALKAKKANYFVPCGGKNITLDGKVAGNEYIDIIRLIDLIQSRMMGEVFGSLTRAPKIPYTNGGISIIQNDIAGVLKANQKTGGVAPDEVDSDGNLVPGFSTSFPKVSDISANDRANRLLTGGSFSARLAGAIQAMDLNGTVTV